MISYRARFARALVDRPEASPGADVSPYGLSLVDDAS
jgi:hypothetical protein